MQEGTVQMHVQTVGIVNQMAADGLVDLARLEVGHDFVVQLCSDRVPSFACAQPCADMAPNVANIVGTSARMAEARSPCSRKRRGGPQEPPGQGPPKNLVCSRYNRGRSHGPTAGIPRLARRLAARP